MIESIAKTLKAINKRKFGDITEKNSLLFEVTKNFKFKAHESRAIINDGYKVTFLVGKYTYSIRNSLSSYITDERYFFANRKDALKFIEENSELHMLKSLAVELVVLSRKLDYLEHGEQLTRINKYIEKLSLLNKN